MAALLTCKGISAFAGRSTRVHILSLISSAKPSCRVRLHHKPSWPAKTSNRTYNMCAICLRKISLKGGSLALVSPFAFFKKKQEATPTHEDQALAHIPKEVFKKDVLIKKKKKRNFIVQILIQLWSHIRVIWRCMSLGFIFGPLLLVYPLAHYSEGFKRRWWRWLMCVCEWSGPTFIKLGQWAGTRRDLFSQEFCDLFSQLHTKVKPHSWYMTRRKLQKAFGRRWTEIFIAVDRKPVGSGCIAQVHKGYMKPGMIPDESVIEEVLEDDDAATDIDFAEGLEIMGFGPVLDSALGNEQEEQLEYEKSWRWWRQRGVPLPSTSPPRAMAAKDEPGLVSEARPSEADAESTATDAESKADPNTSKNKNNTTADREGNGEEEPQPIPVAIKVLHPGVYRAFLRDISILRLAARLAELVLPSLRWLSLPECIEEFSILMKKQVDLRYEAHALDKFVANFAENPNIRFPRPIRPYCKRDVLVETFEEGDLISHYLHGADEPHGLKELLASYGLDALLQMVFVDNLVHGDLHPGNILVQNAKSYIPQEENKLVLVDICDTVVVNVRPAETPIRLVMLDVGISTSLSELDLGNFRDVFAAVVIGDGERVAELMLAHASYHRCENTESFKQELGEVVRVARKNTIKLGKIDVGDLFSNVFSVLSRHKVKLESSFASVILAIFVLEGLGRSLDPELDILERAKPILLS